MNNNRRKEIQSAIAKLEELKSLKDEVKDLIESIQQDEQEYFDNMPESLQTSDRGYKSEEAISQLEDAASMLDDLDIDSITSNLDVAAE